MLILHLQIIKKMSFVEILLIGIGLSMDAFSVSISKGLTTKKFSWKVALTCGLWFGFFQALMPVIGYFLGAQFEQFITSVDHWIAFGLLFLIGANMIREALSKKTENGERNPEGLTDRKGGKTENLPLSTFRSQLQMFPLAIATSIDALAVGISFACIQVRIWSAILIIGVTTFLFSILGVKIGNVFGSRFEKGAGILGGIILILIGLKILLEHLGVMSF